MATAPPRFLLVEDDDVDREAMERGFADAGAGDCLTVVGDGLEALAIMRGDSTEALDGPFVVLVDINMPRMSGLELLTEMRADPALRERIVFVCSTSDSAADCEAAFAHNVAGYISKSRVGTDWERVARLLLEYWSLCELPG